VVTGLTRLYSCSRYHTVNYKWVANRRIDMARNTASTEELAEATERVLSRKEWVVDGVPAEVREVGLTVDGEIDIRTTAGMFTRDEWYAKMSDGEIREVN